MGSPLDSSFNDFFNSGMQAVEPILAEPFTYSGSVYYGIFSEEIYQDKLMGGGFRNVRGGKCVIRKSLMPTYPINGTILIKDNTKFRIEAVTSDTCTYTITLVDTSK